MFLLQHLFRSRIIGMEGVFFTCFFGVAVCSWHIRFEYRVMILSIRPALSHVLLTSRVQHWRVATGGGCRIELARSVRVGGVHVFVLQVSRGGEACSSRVRPTAGVRTRRAQPAAAAAAAELGIQGERRRAVTHQPERREEERERDYL